MYIHKTCTDNLHAKHCMYCAYTTSIPTIMMMMRIAIHSRRIKSPTSSIPIMHSYVARQLEVREKARPGSSMTVIRHCAIQFLRCNCAHVETPLPCRPFGSESHSLQSNDTVTANKHMTPIVRTLALAVRSPELLDMARSTIQSLHS